MNRDNEFWDAIEENGALPAAAKTLGWELVSADPGEGTVEVAFTADDRFLNPVGVVQGGFAVATATAVVQDGALGARQAVSPLACSR